VSLLQLVHQEDLGNLQDLLRVSSLQVVMSSLPDLLRVSSLQLEHQMDMGSFEDFLRLPSL